MLARPAQLLYETRGTFADGFGEVDLIDTPNGCSEILYWVRAAEGKPGEIRVIIITLIYNWRSQAEM